MKYIKNQNEIQNQKINFTGDVVSKTTIWRTAIRHVKQELINQGCRNIEFPNYMDKDNYIALIDEYTYKVKDIVQYVNKDDELSSSYFTVLASATLENSEEGVLLFNVSDFNLEERKD
jgi:hypothetical protein